MLVGARKECPLVVGRGDGEQFLASAIPAFLGADAPRPVHRERRDRRRHARGRDVPRPPTASRSSARSIEIDWDEETAEKGGYETFMLKEIHEQADAVAETIADRTVRGDGVDLGDLGALDDELLRDVARGSSSSPAAPRYHAGLIGRYAIEEWARVPGRDGHRLRVPLPQPGGRPGRPGHRHHAVGRDRRHAGRDAPGARARRHGARGHEHHGLAGHARRRRRALHARRARDRRGGDEDVRLPRSR